MRVPGSSAIRYDGPGHGLYLTGKACVIAHADRYLTDLRLPSPARSASDQAGARSAAIINTTPRAASARFAKSS
ncbi:alpha/beta hydrolase [Nonomuraea sp. LPB2021202275-12-8]|uniref:alpha/beta hydrolase n=1 Tax=Nonomuraea sp. LPB2021202275-12-8 TaxID=3120159 RepID=UPI003FA58447